MSGRSLRKTYLDGARALDVEVRLQDGRLRGSVRVDEDELGVDVGARALDARRVRLERPEGSVRATVLREKDTIWIAIAGRTYALKVKERGRSAGAHVGEDDFAISPMTGSLIKVAVEAGARVEKGAELFVVEAMKMEYVVRAPRDLTVASVGHAAGQQVEQGDVVVRFEEDA